MSDLTTAIAWIQADQERLEEAEAYADNTQSEVFASAKMRRLLERTGRKFRVNWCRTVINSVLNRLELSAISTGDAGADEAIAEVYAANDLGIEAKMFMERALVWGECYCMVWPGDETDDLAPPVEVYLCSPKTTKIFYDTENGREKVYAARMWEEGTLVSDGASVSTEKRMRVNLIYDDRIEKYISIKETGEKDEDFEPYADSYIEEAGANGVVTSVDEWPVPHDLGEIPVFHFRTVKTYGRPEHRDGYGPQDMLNKLTATQMATNDYQGFPQRYALLGRDSAGGSSFEGEFDDDFVPTDGPSALVDADDQESGTGAKAGPGELWLMKADQVGEFKAADPDVFLKPMQAYIRALATSTSTPLHHFEGQGGAPSGESLRVAEAPLTKKVQNRQAMFGNTWRDIFTFALKILGHDSTVTITWKPSQSQDDLQGWALVKAKVDAGMPLRQALIEHGYLPEVADELIKQAHEAAAQPA